MIRLNTDKINERQEKILEILLKQERAQSSGIHGLLNVQGDDVSLVTTKRVLSTLETKDLIKVIGSGRSTAYEITTYGRLMSNIDPHKYCSVDPDKRFGRKKYNFSLIRDLNFNPFTQDENSLLGIATKKYNSRTNNLPPAIKDKELERFIIELSWKSSKIEGNTYTLLDTEKLIREGIEAKGHSKDEARMIINHKEAFKFIIENITEFKTLTLKNAEKVHKILVKGLNVNFGLRKKPVGVTGSLYQPLDNIHQISDAMRELASSVKKIKNVYAKGLITLLGISYIQPFEDGNKRSSRLLANAILLANEATPLSYRAIDENSYREAMLVFYELNSLTAFKKMFIEQYIFSAENYLVK